MNIPQILVTEGAKEHFNHLIAKEEMPGMGLRIFLDQPGHPKADVSIAFCPPGEHRATDIPLPLAGFTLYVDKASAPFLEAAEIDFKKDSLGGQLA
ncbi:MAG TPA: iron-sulfur cluster biosynthesis family protein, partial [Candidatus Berkiella sp.]|nr:iron-sulfur cluster biosynthesis family protein [Candidatus Berkiella sp.]